MPPSERNTGSKLTAAAVKDLSNPDPAVRRKMLDLLIVWVYRPGWNPLEFIAMGGLPPLVKCLTEPDEKMRHHAVEAIDRLAEIGAAKEVREAGALPLLNNLVHDPYEPIQKVAKRASQRIATMTESSGR